MKPHSVAALVVVALLLLPGLAFAADSGSDITPPVAAPDSPDPSFLDSPVNPFLPGEQLLGIAAGAQIPVFLVPTTGQGIANLYVGASFSFSYQYFVARGLAIGGNIAGAFNGTISGQSIFVAPLGFTTSYWFAKLPFEFSVLGEAGAYILRYNTYGMFDPFLQAGGGVYWRSTATWSLGLQAYLWFVPEIHYDNYASLSQYAGFIETSLTAVYHL